MKKNYTITIIAENSFMAEDYMKQIECHNTHRSDALYKAKKIVGDLERMYRHVYIADVCEWSDYAEL